MESVFKVLRQIESTNSRNDKKAILRSNNNNELLKKFLLYTYNPRWMYGIGPKSINIKKYSESNNVNVLPIFKNRFSTIFELCDDLRTHPFGSNEDLSNVNNFLKTQSTEAFYWYSKLLLKDLKIGITPTTINEIYPNLIPEFEVMLAHPYYNHSEKIVGDFQIQQKFDGFRFITYHHPDGTLQFFTRNGVELFGFPEIEFEFRSIPKQAVTMVYDGELIADGFNDTQKLIMRKELKTGLTYHVFDCLTIDEWERGESFDLLQHRYRFLNSMIPQNLPHIKIVPELYFGNDISEITKWFNYAKENKWEGIMVKLNTQYVRKRTTNMLKVKEMDTIDLRVIKVNEGTGKNQGKLGSVTVLLDGVEVDVGSGFTDYLRDYYWKNQNEILDKVIEIQYFEKTVNEQGKPSLRFPVFKRIRIDK